MDDPEIDIETETEEMEEETAPLKTVKTSRSPFSKMNIVVEDRQGNKYYCTKTRTEFGRLASDYVVEVFNSDCSKSKKFIKEYLKIVTEVSKKSIAS